MATSELNADFPAKLQFLFRPGRYKVAYGGRGGAKSWGFARALLILGAQRKLRILCARETQKSIADSVHKLLSDQIAELGLHNFYRILKSSIYGANGTEFLFAGIRQSSVGDVKSYEGCDICWVEEAQIVSKHSWDVLIPTIRKENSEIWVSFNPELEGDATYQRFVVHPPPGVTPVKINWSDNPWFPEVLRQEKDHTRTVDPSGYENIWEGHCRQVVEGAIYKDQLVAMEKEERFTRVPYDPIRPVDTFWDLGYGDNTSIWFAQSIGFEFRLIDFISECQHDLSYYLREMRNRPYIYGTTWLPHDARAKTFAAGGRSIQEQVVGAGFNVGIVPQLSINDGIAAARTLFNRCWFDKEKCADGIQALKHYRYEFDDALKSFKREPLHDWASHPADAFRYFAVTIREPQRKQEQVKQQAYRGNDSWMQ